MRACWRGPLVAGVLSFGGAVLSCTLLIPTGDLHVGPESDAASSGAGDATVGPGPATDASDAASPAQDAATLARRCDTSPPGLVRCEDFDRGFLPSSVGCAGAGTASLSSSAPFSAPNALELRTPDAASGCNFGVAIDVQRSARISFRGRFELVGGRIHLMTLRVGPSFIYMNVYGDHIGLGVAIAKNSSFTYSEPAMMPFVPRADQWVEASLALEGLDSTPNATLTVNGLVLQSGSAALSFAPGSGYANVGVSRADSPSIVILDDVEIVRD